MNKTSGSSIRANPIFRFRFTFALARAGGFSDDFGGGVVSAFRSVFGR
jgi:hypothetical protein